jgi:predicted outer membrane protein
LEPNPASLRQPLLCPIFPHLLFKEERLTNICLCEETMKIQALILCAAMAIPSSLAAQNPAPMSKTNPNPPGISLQAQHFLNVIASEDASEINLANLALKKSANPQVRQYAKSKILAADPSMKTDAITVAKQNRASVPGFPTATDQAEFYYLDKLSGKSFDQEYMSYEDAQQAADLIMVANEAKAAKNPQIKSYAQKEVTPVREAAQSAQQIAQVLISG